MKLSNWAEIVRLVEVLEHSETYDPSRTRKLVGLVASALEDVGPAAGPSDPVTEVPRALDVLEEPELLRSTFESAGLVVLDSVVRAEICDYVLERVSTILSSLAPSFSLEQPHTWHHLPLDPSGVPILTRGFLEIYHDDALAQVRQSPRLWLAHALIWGVPALSVTFDRFAAKLPGSAGLAPLPLHVDQNPLLDAGFASTQGMVAMVDNTLEMGCFQACPGSSARFGDWKVDGEGRGQYVELAPLDHSRNSELWYDVRPVPLAAGQGVIWDSRTVHAAGGSSAPTPLPCSPGALPKGVRLNVLVSAGPAVLQEDMAAIRRSVAISGEALDLRQARAHASFGPRFTDPESLRSSREPERLSALGRALYDSRHWAELL